MSSSNPDIKPNYSSPKAAMKSFSLTLKPNTKSSKFASSTTLGKRPRATLTQDDADGSGDESANGVKHESVTELGQVRRGQFDQPKKSEMLVIPKLKNRDWKSEARAKRGKNLLPQEVQAIQAGTAVEEKATELAANNKETQVQWGLSVRMKAEEGAEDGCGTTADNRTIGTDSRLDSKAEHASTESEQPHAEKIEDELAVAALLGHNTKRSGPDLTIPAIADGDPALGEDSLKRDLRNAPNVSTLEDYERMPVEEFGAALLRGMGWKGEKKAGPKEVKRRQNLLGLGAKELKDAEELGAWVQKSDVKRLQSSTAGGNGYRPSSERRPKASEYRREEERRKERREERHGGGYRRDR